MNKTELVAAIAEEAGVSKVNAKAALDALSTVIYKAMKKGDKVTILGFGTFSVAKRAARKGINPATGKKINIPARNVVKFKPGSGLKLGK